jgi:hypothetical protein
MATATVGCKQALKTCLQACGAPESAALKAAQCEGKAAGDKQTCLRSVATECAASSDESCAAVGVTRCTREGMAAELACRQGGITQ